MGDAYDGCETRWNVVKGVQNMKIIRASIGMIEVSRVTAREISVKRYLLTCDKMLIWWDKIMGQQWFNFFFSDHLFLLIRFSLFY